MVSPSHKSVNVGLIMIVGISVSLCVHVCVSLLPSDCTTGGSQRVQRGEGNSH